MYSNIVDIVENKFDEMDSEIRDLNNQLDQIKYDFDQTYNDLEAANDEIERLTSIILYEKEEQEQLRATISELAGIVGKGGTIPYSGDQGNAILLHIGSETHVLIPWNNRKTNDTELQVVRISQVFGRRDGPNSIWSGCRS